MVPDAVSMHKLKRYWLPIAIATTWLLFKLLEAYPQLTELFFASYWFVGYRNFWDHTFGYLPFSLVYLWFFCALGTLVFLLVRWRKQKQSFRKFLLGVIGFFGIHYCLFYWMWGFQYTRTMPWIAQSVSDASFYKEYHQLRNVLVNLRENCSQELFGFDTDKLEHELRPYVLEFLCENGLKTSGKPRCKFLYPAGSLLLWSTSGMYLPFAGESIIDPGLPPLALPFTMAHELAHAYGITDEGICNFIAYWACSKSADSKIRYAGHFNYFKYLLREIQWRDPSFYRCERESLPKSIDQDLKEYAKTLDRYPEILPEFRDWMYDWYLKRHGISKGKRSYHQVVSLVIHYRDHLTKDSK